MDSDCPVCLEPFEPPIMMLNCGHNLCQNCTNDLATRENNNQEWTCPICRKTQYKNQEIPRNWLAEQALRPVFK